MQRGILQIFRNLKIFKLERSIDCFNFLQMGMGHKINSPHVFTVIIAFIKEGIGIVKYILLQLVIIIHLNPTKPEINKVEIPQLAEFKIQADKRSGLGHPFSELTYFSVQLLPAADHLF